MNHIPATDIERLSAAYEFRVRATLAGDFPVELRLSDRLAPGRWVLEWSLAKWLGDAFGLDPDVTTEICLSNVLGLASIRLGDDLEDGEVPAAVGTLPAAEVSERLYNEALAVYRCLFGPTSDFWTYLDLRMGEWRAATSGGGSQQQLLSMRGAPLTISAFAVCLLTAHQREFEAVARCLDHALTAMVLYDSVIDWREDLASGRWNPFVDAVASSIRARRREPATSADVQIALLTTDLIEAHFRLIGDELGRAGALASALGVGGLHAHLTQLAARLDAEGSGLAERYREIGEAARLVMFGEQPQLAA